ncbi:sensor histidine kinase, partial [Nocardioides sp.]|uniref:sensor histidine kinase n=1 Tax=Nocardioides sp. TaxID=35761 RepID=UPI002732E4B2
ATLAAVSVATRRRWGPIVLVAVAVIAGGQGFPMVQPVATEDPAWLTFGVNTVVAAAMMAWGMYLGSRRELIWTLEQRAHRAETEQELRVTQARTNERARIAREMHDVLAHRISQISLHAGACAFREDLTAEEMRDSATIIQQKANEALTDLRGVLGVLRDPDTGELTSRPQPALDDLPSLIADARESGMHIEYADHVDRAEEMPLVVGRTIYRIVQEGLTNAHKHAPGTLVTVQVSGSPDDGVDVLLRNPVGFGHLPTAPGAGLGLIGLTERAQLRGGSLEHRRDGSMFVLHGWIPWAA